MYFHVVINDSTTNFKVPHTKFMLLFSEVSHKALYQNILVIMVANRLP